MSRSQLFSAAFSTLFCYSG